MLFVSNNPVPYCPYNMWSTFWPGPVLPQLYPTPMDAFFDIEEVLSSCELPNFSPGLLSLQPQRESMRDWHAKLQHLAFALRLHCTKVAKLAQEWGWEKHSV